MSITSEISEHIYQLSESALQVLQCLLGERVHQLVTLALNVEGTRVIAEYFAISVPEHHWVIMESDRGNTPEEGIGFHAMQVRFARSLRDVSVESDDMGRRIIQQPHSIVRLFADGGIQRISVYAREDSGAKERVLYDSAILFEYGDGKRFMVSAYDSIAGGVQFSAAVDDIDEVCSECVERVVIGI